MDFLTHESIHHWLIEYGSIILFFLLAIGIIALPVPEETMMVIAGVLLAQGHLKLIVTLIAAYAGSICGITGSYFIGRTLGSYFIKRYGKYVGIKETHVDKAHLWFEYYGKWALLIGYFIPGVRHFTGLSAGISKLEYPTFALFAYTGAIIWVSTFLSLGYFFNGYWVYIFEQIDEHLDDAILIAVLVLICFLFYYVNKQDRQAKG
jgi:membrane protein DedA with SNARE-associated domain